MIVFLECFRYMSCFVVLIGRFRRRHHLRFCVGGAQVTPDSEINGYTYGDHCCGAQYQNDEQNLDHHRHSGYQIEVHRL